MHPFSRRSALAGLFLTVSAPFAVAASTTPPDPSRYPILDEKQLGHVNAIVRLAGQLNSDWSGMGSDEPGQGGFDAYRYQLAMMSYTLSLVQYHYTPAYRELTQATDARLIDKMLLFDVWGFWELTSRGAKSFDPDLKELGEGWIDPVKRQNIMYSGHLFQMINTHQMLYADGRYDQPGSVRFVYEPAGRGMGRQDFVYDNHSLAKVLADQFRESGWKGIECEPNAIFPECNQHPLLGFALYDRRHGTDYFKTISAAYKRQFDDLNYVDPKTSSFMMMYMVRQEKTVPAQMAWADGWSGSFMHAWYKPQVESLYPVQKAHHLVQLPDGTATVKATAPSHFYSHDHGFFALLAAEVGDTDTRDRMLAYADRHWAPQWRDGAYIFPREDRFKFDADGADVWRRVQPLTGNGLIGLARINVRDGLYDLFNKPFDDDHFRQPYISGIATGGPQVARARFDDKAKALIVTLRPGREAGAGAWTVNNLTPGGSYGLWRDGVRLASLRKGKLLSDAAVPSGALVAKDGSLRVDLPVTSETSFVLMQE